MSGIHERARQGFGRAGTVAAYERGRPGYPADAVAELVRVLGLAPGTTVLDLAAGTGKLTRQLLATGAAVVAVEPVAAMRDRLAQVLDPGPGGPATWARVVGGTAEAIPVRDGSLDAVTVGQAFHWFDAPRAVAELHRVLRPGGRLGLIWNVRDESRPAVAEIGAILDRHAGDAPRYRDGRWRAAFDAGHDFTPLRERTFRHLHHLDRAAVLDRFASISFIAALPDADRARVLAEIDQVIAAEPSLAGQDRIGLPYRTDLYWCRRGGDADTEEPFGVLARRPGPRGRRDAAGGGRPAHRAGGARRVAAEDWRPEELPVDGWEEFRVTDRQHETIRRRFHSVDKGLSRRGVRFMFGAHVDQPEWSLVRIHPGASGLAPRAVLDRLLGRAS